jgi:two-component system response regulator HydG
MSKDRAARVLVVDDELSMAEMITDALVERGYDAVAISSSKQAATMLEQERFDALVTDLRMPQVDGLGLLEISKHVAPDRPVIIMTAYSAVESAVESIRRGAHHYLTKPFKTDELVLFLQRALDEARLRQEAGALRRALQDRFSIEHFIGDSHGMREVRELTMRLAETSVPVLIVGETGTGKGLIARAIHAHSSRARAPFVTVNCAALPENLLESELFGHVKGAFTGATAHRVGLYEEADNGTIFLDEIGELPLPLQSKLLDVLERGVVRAVGSNKERQVDVRVVAATHRNLRARVASGEFREDLLYRLEVVTVEIPPLRQRRDDIPGLLEHFLQRSRQKHPQSVVTGFAPDALARLVSHVWQGNVRELEHVVERLVLLGRTALVTDAELPKAIGASSETPPDFGDTVLPLREMQRRYVAWAYDKLGGKKLATAETLGIDDKTLAKYLKD